MGREIGTFFIISHSVLFKMKNDSDKSCGESQNTLLMSNNFFFRKPCHVLDKVTKYRTPDKATDGNMAGALCILDT
jgi:hypothetical protein